jgi:hypothetical protein
LGDLLCGQRSVIQAYVLEEQHAFFSAPLTPLQTGGLTIAVADL